MIRNKNLKRRLLKLLYDHKEEHVGSCFTSIDIIDDIFQKKDPKDLFILSNGHAAYALYTVLEKYKANVDADELADLHGGHPNFDPDRGIDCSTGSLGSGIAIAVGRALADPSRKVYVLISDGECAEGSVWEALRFIHDKRVDNIEVHCNANGWACYETIDVDLLENRLHAFLPGLVFHRTNFSDLSFMKGLDAHYMILNETEYLRGQEELA